MKASVPTKSLRAAIERIRLLPQTQLVMSCAMLIVLDEIDGMKIIRRTGQSEIEIIIPDATVSSDGECWVYIAPVERAANQSEDDNTSFEFDGKDLKIKTGKIKATASGLLASEVIPGITIKDTGQIAAIKGKDLHRGIKICGSAIPNEKGRADFMYLGVRKIAGKNSFIGIDGRRIHVHDFPVDGIEFEIARPFIRMVDSLFSEADSVDITKIVNGCQFSDGECLLTILDPEIKKPDLDEILKKANPKGKLALNREQMKKAVKSACRVNGEGTIRIVLNKGKAEIIGESAGDEFSIEVSCKHNLTAKQIGVNGNYLFDLIEATEEDEFEVGYDEPSTTFLYKSPTTTIVLMGTRIQQPA